MSAARTASGAAGERLALLHRRMCVGMALAGIVAFSAGVGWSAPAPLLSAAILLVTLYWRLSPATSAKLEPLWLPLGGAPDALLTRYWEALEPANRVAIALKWIPLRGGAGTLRVVNRHS